MEALAGSHVAAQDPQGAVPEFRQTSTEREDVTDAEYLAKRKRRVIEIDDDYLRPAGNGDITAESPLNVETGGKDPAGQCSDSHGEEAERQILASGRLFLRNLGYSVSEQLIRSTFARFGQITEVIGLCP